MAASQPDAAHSPPTAGPVAPLDQNPAALANLLANLVVGVLVVDDTSVVLYCNALAGDLLGIDPRASLGHPLGEALAPIRPLVLEFEGVRKQWREAIAQAHTHPSIEFTIQRDNARRDVQASVFRVGRCSGSGEPQSAHIGVVLRDVTAERAAERERTRLLSVVSHELRNPMSIVLGYAELMTLGRGGPNVMQMYAEQIHKESGRIIALLDDLLALRPGQSSSIKYKFQSVDLRAVIVDTAAPFRTQSTRHVLVLDLPLALPLVRADPTRLKQVIANLLSNALKYSPHGGEVRIQAALEAPQTGDKPVVRVSVRDEGLGIPPEALSQLFAPFYRVDSQDREGIPGTGLGLAISKQIVETHGGRLSVRSTVGRGSTFCFTIPVAS